MNKFPSFCNLENKVFVFSIVVNSNIKNVHSKSRLLGQDLIFHLFLKLYISFEKYKKRMADRKYISACVKI